MRIYDSIRVESNIDALSEYRVDGKTFMHDGGTGTSNNVFIGGSGNTTQTGNGNIGMGVNALLPITTGRNNVAIGTNAGRYVQTGWQSVYIGEAVLSNVSNTNPVDNVIIGHSAGSNLTSSNTNTLIGHQSGFNGTTGSFNIGIGYRAGHSAAISNSIAIGKNAVALTNQSMVIGGLPSLSNSHINVLYIGSGQEVSLLSDLVDVTISATSLASGSVTNGDGDNLTIAGSKGTGTGIGGDIIFQVAPAGASGTTQNPLQNILFLSGVGDVMRQTNTGGTAQFQIQATNGASLIKLDALTTNQDSYIHFANGGTNEITIGWDDSQGYFRMGTSAITTGTFYEYNTAAVAGRHVSPLGVGGTFPGTGYMFRVRGGATDSATDWTAEFQKASGAAVARFRTDGLAQFNTTLSQLSGIGGSYNCVTMISDRTSTASGGTIEVGNGTRYLHAPTTDTTVRGTAARITATKSGVFESYQITGSIIEALNTGTGNLDLNAVAGLYGAMISVINQTTGTTTVNTLAAVVGNVQTNAITSGITTDAVVFQARFDNVTNGTYTNMKYFEATVPSNTSGASVTDSYVLYAAANTLATNNWGLYLLGTGTTSYIQGDLDIDSGINVDGGAVFNEDGGNFDFRVEGDTDQNLFFVDASADQVGIKTNTPSSALDVAGDVEIGSVNAFYLGDPNTEGTWRIIRSGNNLLMERYEGSPLSWIVKQTISA